MQFDDARIQQMIRGTRAVKTVPFPGLEGVQVGVRVLLDQEIDDARLGAQQYYERRCSQLGLDASRFLQGDPDALDREFQRQMLQRALVDPESPEDDRRPFFPADTDIRRLTSVQVQRLWEVYLDWQDAVYPRELLSKEAIDELVEALKKKDAEKAVLAHFAPDTLASLVRSLAEQLST